MTLIEHPFVVVETEGARIGNPVRPGWVDLAIEVPLANIPGLISGALEHVPKRELVDIQREIIVIRAVCMRITACHVASARRSAHGTRDEEVPKDCALFTNRVNVGSS